MGRAIHIHGPMPISGQARKINIKFWVGRCSGQTGTIPGTNGTPSMGQNSRFLFNSTLKSPFCPVCLWDRWGFALGTIVPKGHQKNVYVFCVYWLLFAPNQGKLLTNLQGHGSIHRSSLKARHQAIGPEIHMDQWLPNLSESSGLHRHRSIECFSLLVAPYRAILRYYRCDTPYCAILFKGGYHSPKMVRYPPSVLSFTQAHLRDTPFCYVSRDNCAIPH